MQDNKRGVLNPAAVAIRRVLSVLIPVWLVLGCSSGDDETPPTASTESQAGQDAMTPVEIREASIEGDDERRLILDVSYCTAEIASEVSETDAEVTITVTHRNVTGEDCGGGVIVELDDPLGERAVIDGASGQPVTVIRDPADTGS